LESKGANITIDVANKGDYIFTLNAAKPKEPTLSVQRKN
jgi:hypothetical protein